MYKTAIHDHLKDLGEILDLIEIGKRKIVKEISDLISKGELTEEGVDLELTNVISKIQALELEKKEKLRLEKERKEKEREEKGKGRKRKGRKTSSF